MSQNRLRPLGHMVANYCLNEMACTSFALFEGGGAGCKINYIYIGLICSGMKLLFYSFIFIMMFLLFARLYLSSSM